MGNWNQLRRTSDLNTWANSGAPLRGIGAVFRLTNSISPLGVESLSHRDLMLGELQKRLTQIDCCSGGGNLWAMKAGPSEHASQQQGFDRPPAQQRALEESLDSSLLEESLAKTVWERMLANDDALRLADLLQAAMLKSRAKP